MEEEGQLPVRDVVRQAIEEFVRAEQDKNEPAYKAELLEERRKREQIERRLNELVEENQRARQRAEEAERSAAVRAELQRLGVTKVDLAYKAIREDVVRGEDGRLLGRSEQGEVSLRDYLSGFVNENPEFLPARITGGSGVLGPARPAPPGPAADLDRIRPGMSSEEAERIRQEILRVAGQTQRGA